MTVIGVRAHDYGKQPVESLCRSIAADGWRTIQLAFPKAVEGVNGFDGVTLELTARTDEALKQNGLGTAVLGVYIEPSLADESARREQAGFFTAALSQAKILGAGCVGTETTSMSKQPEVSREDALKQLLRSLEEILPEAERLGVDVALEPVHYHTVNTPELTRQVLDEMRSSRLKVIFDPVNLLRAEDIDSQAALWRRCADSFGDKIRAVHIKGASRESKNGVLLNTTLEDSVVDYAALFQALRGVEAPLLRELAVPARAAEDIRFLTSQLETFGR